MVHMESSIGAAYGNQNWIDFSLYTAYFIRVIVVLIPLGINFTYVVSQV